MPSHQIPQETTIVLVTGINGQNLGHAIVEALIESSIKSGKKWIILVTSRTLGRAEEAVKEMHGDHHDCEIVPLGVDLDNDDEVLAVRDQVGAKYGRLDVLVNNAAMHLDYQLRDGQLDTREAFNRSFNTNVASTHLFTQAFIPLLLASKSPRLVFISSGISSLTTHDDQAYPINHNPPAGWPKPWTPNVTTYRTSKTAGNMMAMEWARVLKNDGVKVLMVDPGYLATGLGKQESETQKRFGAQDPIVGGRLIRSVMEGERDADQGKLITNGGVIFW